ncbi:MAG TPA: hypothetical protein VNN08_10995 [Thermoanaerobaculia bacterium]|nr:hypothetical protein [Thermoanaerobaculia bacterium]
MTLDEFSGKLQNLWRAAQDRLGHAGMDERYYSIPLRELQRIYEKHRNLNFNTPSNPLELVIVACGFVEIEIIHRLKEEYFGALGKPSTWTTVVDRCEKLAGDLENEILGEMQQALDSAIPVT